MPEVVLHFTVIALVVGGLIGLAAWLAPLLPFVPERARSMVRWSVIAAGLLLALIWLMP